MYDANGQLLYSFDHTGFGPEASGWNFETLVPPSLSADDVTGVAFPGSLLKISQSRDEGRTWLAQTANIDVRPVYVNGPYAPPAPTSWRVPGVRNLGGTRPGDSWPVAYACAIQLNGAMGLYPPFTRRRRVVPGGRFSIAVMAERQLPTRRLYGRALLRWHVYEYGLWQNLVSRHFGGESSMTLTL
ncbi:MAG: hypothetical protein IPI73_16180 [Betaproteobacteria bacterium]|nr:hypothetical protein [Betaproteobacteria bacterium]